MNTMVLEVLNYLRGMHALLWTCFVNNKKRRKKSIKECFHINYN